MCYKKYLTVLAAVLFIFLIGGCSSDEESPVAPTPPPKAPAFELKAIDLPNGLLQSTDAKAKLAVQLIDEVNSFEGTPCVFAAPTGAQAVKEVTGSWEYQWITGSLTQNLKITAAEGRLTWQLFWDGVDQGKSFTNWRKMDAVQRTDESNGHVYLYLEGSQQITMEWVWYTLENGDYTMVKQNHQEPISKIDITIKTDKSGKLERFSKNSKGSLVYDLRITWAADGAGEWWTYTDGVQSDYGKWN